MALNVQQAQAAQLIQQGVNVFITGSGGVGKSYLLQQVLQGLPSALVTASTGMAAIALGGTTVHSAFGLGLADAPVPKLMERVLKNGRARKRLRAAKVLVCDEVSMLTPHVFRAMDAAARMARGKPQPFGGLRLVLCGDFFQLPPVISGEQAQRLNGDHMYAFETDTWRDADIHVVNLTTPMRQAEDARFVRLLERVRWGRTSREDMELLQRQRPLEGATTLYTRRITTEAANAERMEHLDGPTRVWGARYGTDGNGPVADALLKLLQRNCPAPESVELRVGTLVMLRINLDLEARLVNGSVGTVERFSDTDPPYPVVRFTSSPIAVAVEPHTFTAQQDGVTSWCRQLPLVRAWALTVHKVQGATLDACVADLDGTFAHGQAYVALSRARSLDTLCVRNMPSRIEADERVVAFYQSCGFDGPV